MMERQGTTLALDLLGDLRRTHHCGELRKANAGQQVFLAGWVARRRDLGNLIFLDLRDHTGVVQVVVNAESSPEAHAKSEQVRNEYVVGVEGEVVLRAPDTVNSQIATGEVEVKTARLLLLNEAKTPPFPIEDETRTAEDTRLRYRYLDLRRARMQRNIRLRHQVCLETRKHMGDHGFIEIETPFMTRSTPEGARDYLVPSRVRQGHFYALPQSPQLFKQLLMIAGFDRYFQIVRCFRDEDLRADRQPEFTQIDVEMAFPTREELFEIIEGLMQKLLALVDVRVELPFARLSYDTAMEKYGSDKPDLRFGLEWKRLELSGFPRSGMNAVKGFQVAKALRVPGAALHQTVQGAAAKISRSQFDRYQDTLKQLGAANSAYLTVTEAGVQSRMKNVLGDDGLAAIVAATEAQAGDLVILLGAESDSIENLRGLSQASGWLRLELASRFELIKPGLWSFAWIVDFPMFDYDVKEKRYAAMHHPFTSPREEDLDKLESDPSGVKALAYDLVLNGQEIGGGSIRMHRPDIQKRVFRVLGLSDEKARERFGFFMDALEYGAPPHGGIALGVDRITALLAGESSIREVIAFPKTASATDLMCDAPAAVDPEQLAELGLKIMKS
ncbi:MAG TPA: aspartate--tRNA ligase [Terriglobia bacterium]|nr:aspartate--tRNA ligase [Terriglobia bacterium]